MVDFTEGYRPKESETQKAIKLLQSKGYDVVPSRPYDFVEVTKPTELTEVQYQTYTGGPWHNAKVVAYYLDEVWLHNLDNNGSMVLLADDVKFRMLRVYVTQEKPTGPGNRCIRENGVYPPGAE